MVAAGSLLVRQILPARNRQMVGPFISMDQCGPTYLKFQESTGFGEQPHAGLAKLTYLLEGTVIHRDSAGVTAKVRPGDVALMTAGSGVVLEEMLDPYLRGKIQDVYFVHLWIALPDGFENITPDFELHRQSELPEVILESGYAWVLIGSAWGVSAPTTRYTDTLLVDILLCPGGETSLSTNSEECAIYLLEGTALLDGQRLETHKLVVFEAGSNPVLSSQDGCRALLLGGAVFPAERFISGSIVASSEIKLSDQIDAFRRGDFPCVDEPVNS